MPGCGVWGGGGQGGLNLPLPVPFNSGSRPVFFGSRSFAFFRLRNIAQCCIIFPFFSRFPPPWESRFPPPLLPPPVHLPPPFLPVSRPPAPPHEYGMQPNHLLAAMRDGASVNEAGLRQVMFFFPNILNVICVSHTIDNVGKHFEFSVLDTFSRCWNTMFFSQSSCSAVVEDKNWHSNATSFQNQMVEQMGSPQSGHGVFWGC